MPAGAQAPSVPEGARDAGWGDQLRGADSGHSSSPAKQVEEQRGGGDRHMWSSTQTPMLQRSIHGIVPQSGGLNNEIVCEVVLEPLSHGLQCCEVLQGLGSRSV